jgi:membrane fusion protein, multidrug efflux system
VTPNRKLPPGNPNTLPRFSFRTRRRAWADLELENRCAAWSEANGGQAREKVALTLAWAVLFVYMRTMQLTFVSRLPPLVRRVIEPKPTEKEVLNTIASPAMDGIRSYHWALALFWVTSLTACKFTHTETNNAPPPPSVTVSSGEQSQVIDWEIATARIDAVDAVEIRPRVSGHITEIHFAAGQIVHKGDVLFVIDRRWYKAELDRTTAEVARAAAALENAQRISKRADELLKSHTISQEEADGRRSELAEAVAALKSAEAARDSAQLDYEQSEVRAPISGRISRAFLTEGNYASGVPGSNTLLTTIVSVDPVYTYATLDEAAYLRLLRLKTTGQLPLDQNGNLPIQMELTDEEGFPRTGYIESFDNRVTADTASITVRAVFPNTDGRLTPGLFARVRIPATAQHSALLISETAIGTDQGQRYVLVVGKDYITQYRKVTLGGLVEGKRIVTAGISPADQIIVDGQARVRPGMKVLPQATSKSASIPPKQKES